MAGLSKNVIVVGGSYAGRAVAKELASLVPSTHRILLVEPHSHFHHLFVFFGKPRFSIVPGHEHKAFIPYSGLFTSRQGPSGHAVVSARVLSVAPRHVKLDREWQGSDDIHFDFLVVATGTVLPPPGSMRIDDKQSCVEYLREHQDQVRRASSALIIGGGPAGVQMATDLKELYPAKKVVLVQSREFLMPLFHHKLHEFFQQRFEELGIELITGTRAVVPAGGFMKNGDRYEIQFTNGSTVSTDVVILATGQKPNNGLVADLDQMNSGSIVNPKNGFIRVRPTLQFHDERYGNLFAVGDIADTGCQKAARPGVAQAAVAAKNIHAMIEGRKPQDTYSRGATGIHTTTGLTRHAIFRDPFEPDGRLEPEFREMHDGALDMSVEEVWHRHGVVIRNPEQLHL